MRLSGLQRDVLALYRMCLRESRKKPVVSYMSQISYLHLAKRFVDQDILGCAGEFSELC